MADYRPLLIRAISRLDSNTPASRQAVYTRARAGLIALLNGQDHPQTSEEDFERERHALEDAIGKVEFGMIVGRAKPTRPSTVTAEKDGPGRSINEVPRRTEPGAFRGHSEFVSFFDAIGDETFDFRVFEREAERAEDPTADSLSKK
jgi:hypothetical protein